MRLVLKLVGGLLVAVVLIAGGLLTWAFATEHRPAGVEVAEAACVLPPRVLRRGEPFVVLSWNVQYAGSREHHFFYDGGRAAHVPRADMDRALRGLIDAIKAENPDLVLIQELDRGADRTHRVDQLAALQEAGAWPCSASAVYWRSPFVPTPPHEMLGRVEMHESMLSRFELLQSTRIQLALLNESRLNQVFNLKRALHTAEIRIEGSTASLAVANTHLSAFSYGDGTLEQQVATLEEWMGSRPAEQPWLLAGDLNLLPPGDDAARLGDDADEYLDDPNPTDRLIPRFHEAFEGALLAPESRTYQVYGGEPDRKIDYLFYGGPLQLRTARVLREHAAWSDHLPIRAEFVL